MMDWMAGPRRPRIRTVEVDGQALRVGVRLGTPDGPPLLICNGIGANLELMEPFTTALAGIETVVFDVPGVGGSPAPTLAVPLRGLGPAGQPADDAARLRRPGRRARRVVGRRAGTTVRLPYRSAAAAWFLPPHRRPPSWCREPLGYWRAVQSAPLLGPRVSRQGRGGAIWRRLPPQARSAARPTAAPSARHAGFATSSSCSPAGGWRRCSGCDCWAQPTLVMAGIEDPIVPLGIARFVALTHW